MQKNGGCGNDRMVVLNADYVLIARACEYVILHG